ncbi:MAG: threonylcarbamoyl-AMP synthase [Acetobacteraceae bacterium]|nr:threonylcarbamoyl-AMP synthase [Acetobacteraceae bacterium]
MTERLSPDRAGLARACALLRAGKLVAFGTETVYGLGADATNDHAVASVFVAKGRPHFNPLIAHYPDAEAAFAHVRATDMARQLADAFWPGPLTLVLRRADACPISLLASAGLDTQAVRVPAHADTLALLRAVGQPIAGPSANRSGQVSPTSAAHVLAELSGRIAGVLESGPCEVGVESTVLDISGDHPVLLRAGGITLEAIEAVIGPVAHTAPAAGVLRSPGLLASHYAPTLPVRLTATEMRADEALLAFGPPLPGAGLVFQLSAAQNLAEAAARLFAGLRWLDTQGQTRGLVRIAAMAVPSYGLGRAINDRLHRAAAPRA